MSWLLCLTALAVPAMAQIPAVTPADKEDYDLVIYLVIVLVTGIVLALLWRIANAIATHLRLIACLNNDKQRYFSTPNDLVAFFRKHLLDAPLFGKRHMREFRPSPRINLGTLPSRLQTLMLTIYIGLNIVFCVIKLGYGANEKTMSATFRDRTGVLAVFNMIPLFLLAGRTNPLIELLQIPFDTCMLLHRWLGRLVALQALAHSLSWIIVVVQVEGGWKVLSTKLGEQMITTGLVGTITFLVLVTLAWKPLRTAAYEFFLYIHIALSIVLLAVVWIHIAGYTAQAFLIPTIGIWAGDRALRFLSTLVRNLGGPNGSTTAHVEALPGEAVKVTLSLARPWTFRPGQHAYLTIPSVGLFTNHPFSLAWGASPDLIDPATAGEATVLSPSALSHMEKGTYGSATEIDNSGNNKNTQMSFVIRARTGFTQKLFQKANAAPAGRFTARAFVEGPYGGQDLKSYGTVMLFAAGIGVTHHVPQIRELVARYGSATGATRKIVLVWVIQSPEHLEWIRTWMTEILALPGRREVLKVLLFVSRPRSTKEIHSPSSSVQMFPGKPNINELVDREMECSVGATAISACGTGSMGDDVRQAARRWMGRRNVRYFEDAFSW